MNVLHTVLDESLVTNIAHGLALCYIYHSTLILDPYFIQTGGSAPSNSCMGGLKGSTIL